MDRGDQPLGHTSDDDGTDPAPAARSPPPPLSTSLPSFCTYAEGLLATPLPPPMMRLWVPPTAPRRLPLPPPGLVRVLARFTAPPLAPPRRRGEVNKCMPRATPDDGSDGTVATTPSKRLAAAMYTRVAKRGGRSVNVVGLRTATLPFTAFPLLDLYSRRIAHYTAAKYGGRNYGVISVGRKPSLC